MGKYSIKKVLTALLFFVIVLLLWLYGWAVSLQFTADSTVLFAEPGFSDMIRPSKVAHDYFATIGGSGGGGTGGFKPSPSRTL